jgi:alkylation response protein AidB-like acyl-CoA dehydrogenase
VPDDARLMPEGLYFQAAARYPHMFATLSPTYMGIAQAAYDFTVQYLRGEVPGMPPVKRRMYPTKQVAVAEMRIKLEQTRALFLQRARREGRPRQGQRHALYAAHYTIMENANDICAAGDPHLRRAVDAEVAAARAPVPRQPLRLADAALDGRAVPGPARAVDARLRSCRFGRSLPIAAAYRAARSDRRGREGTGSAPGAATPSPRLRSGRA